MYTQYIDAPTPVRYESKWHLGWNSCLLFLMNLMFLTLYAIVPDLSLRLVWAGITVTATPGILMAMFSIVFGKFWLSKIYATCGLIGNICVPLWLLLSL